MALGSSAPEILLSCIELFGNKFKSGELGPSTIVGSAAFNLMVILAVCVYAIPDGDRRYIKEMDVFWVTSFFSIFAYMWIVFILGVCTPGVVDRWEASATLFYFFLLVTIAYMADIGTFNLHSGASTVRASRTSMDSIRSVIKTRRSTEVTSNAVAEALTHRRKLELKETMSRACRRVQATRVMMAGRHIHEHPTTFLHHPSKVTSILSRPQQPSESFLAEQPGVLRFDHDTMDADGFAHEMSIPVHRINGADGEVSCAFHTEPVSAMPAFDYKDTSGVVRFANGQTQAHIVVDIMKKGAHESSDVFRVILDGACGGAAFDKDTDGGSECCILTVTIQNDVHGERSILRWFDGLVNMDAVLLTTTTWAEQFEAALFVNGSLAEQRESSCRDWLIHIIVLPWKLAFSIVPPTTYANGWLCFACAIVVVGMVTALIGDLASLFGCCAGIPKSLTAITFVALGTSMPDTFASKSAAQQDPHADAAVGNVTGSNAVNVFLGLGLPWTFAAFYWHGKGKHFEVGAGDLNFSVCVFTICSLACLSVLSWRRSHVGAELGGPWRAKAMTSTLFVLLWFFYIICSCYKVLTPNASLQQQSMVVAGGFSVVLGLTYLVGKCLHDSSAPLMPPEINGGRLTVGAMELTSIPSEGELGRASSAAAAAASIGNASVREISPSP
eukprot:NODE_618_length_2883_cov_11.812772.p1 GENE.NODE_618_length_2883_cov_11.812772~~NODE_618_length_2883_cov_11.812772.p1  ORF type:complete len:671 (-),score=150.71 NODE_618_length_2883_cov_11.812772:476-2488(-)